MRRILFIILAVVALGAVAWAQVGPRAIANLPGKVDSNYALVVAAPNGVGTTQVGPAALANLPGKTDTNGALVVAFSGGTLALSATAFASLPSSTNGTMLYCNDCTVATAPCTGGGTGAFAFRVNGAWRCQ